MLVLARRVGEEVIIGGNVHITLLEAVRGRVRLGVTAPPAVRVDRSEVATRRHRIARRPLPAVGLPAAPSGPLTTIVGR